MKCGLTTPHCLSMLEQKTSTSRGGKIFNVAGNKDKHAVTCQMVTAYHMRPKQIKNAVADMTNIKVGNFEYVEEQLRLGCLEGNGFEIALRNIQTAKRPKREKLTLKQGKKELKARLKIMK